MPVMQVLAPFSANQRIKNPPESIDVDVVAIAFEFIHPDSPPR